MESYCIPDGLVSTPDESGDPIPERIYPIFLDNVSLPANASLSSAIRQALDRSKNLIVLCSAQAAQSTYVAEEVAYFKSLQRNDRIFTVLLDGDPITIDGAIAGEFQALFPDPVPDRDCSGQLTSTAKADVLCADFRLPDGHQGFTSNRPYAKHLKRQHVGRVEAVQLLDAYKQTRSTACLKLLSGLLGVSLDKLMQRHNERQLAEQKARTRRAIWLGGAMSALAVVAVAGALFSTYQYRQTVKERDRAEVFINELASNLNLLNEQIRVVTPDAPLGQGTEITDQALRITKLLETYEVPAKYLAQQRARALALAQKGKAILRAHGDPVEAVALLEQALRLFELASKEDSADAVQIDDLSVIFNWLGDAHQLLGNYADSLHYHESELTLTTILSEEEPNDLNRQHARAVSMTKVAKAHWLLGQTNGADQRYMEAIELRKSLIRMHPEKAHFHAELGLAYLELSQVRFSAETGRPITLVEGAVRALDTAVKLDQDNLEYLARSSQAHRQLGLAYYDRAPRDEVLSHLQQAVSIGEVLLRRDASNELFLDVQASALSALGHVLFSYAELTVALEKMQASVQLRRLISGGAFISADENALWLAKSLRIIGDLWLQRWERGEALISYTEALASARSASGSKRDAELVWTLEQAVAELSMD